MPRDAQAEAITFASDARTVIVWSTSRLDRGEMSLPEYAAQLDVALGLIGRAKKLAIEAQCLKDQLSLPV